MRACSPAHGYSTARTTSATSYAHCATPSSRRKRAERRRPPHGLLRDQLDLVADPLAREQHAGLEAGELYAAVAALPGDFRDVVVAVDVSGLSYKEAARVLHIRTGTVMSRLYRARQQIVRQIDGGPAVGALQVPSEPD